VPCALLKCSINILGIVRLSYDHGRRSRETRPPEFGVGDASANCPPQILSYRYKKERSAAFKIRRNPFFRPRLCPEPHWGSSRRSHTPSPLGREHPFPYPTPLGTEPPLALAMRSPEFQPDLRLRL